MSMENNHIVIYIDDERSNPHRYNSVSARNYDDAIELIQMLMIKGYSIIVDLDHDLGVGRTGYDICKWIVENHVPLEGYAVHSMNPVGANNMISLLNHYGYKRFYFDNF